MVNKKKKMPLDCTDRQGRTPLIYVAKYKSPVQSEFAEQLLSSGAHVNLKDAFGRTGTISILGKYSS
jgi:ankyrin repeat protein